MAAFTYHPGNGGSAQFDMSAADFFFTPADGDVTSVNSSSIVVTIPNTGTQTYFGSFDFYIDPITGEPFLLGGQITGFQFKSIFSDSWGFYDITGLNIPAEVWATYVLADDYAGFQSVALSGSDQITGGTAYDTLLGYAGDDTFVGGWGDDFIDGGTGTDTAVFEGRRSDYHITRANGQVIVDDQLPFRDRVDTLVDVEKLQFSDGTITINVAPVVTAANMLPSRGTTAVAGSALFSTSDADGDTITQYRVYDNTVGNGRFYLNGVAQVEHADINLTAAQLAGLSFVLGAPGTSDLLWAQVYDGFTWSDWQSFTLTAPINHAPVVAGIAQAPAHGATSVAASSLFSASDADGDTISYEFWDSGTDPNSGHFVLNGVAQGTDVAIPVSAADLANLSFQLGSVSDQLYVRAFDGAAWTIWKGMTVAAPTNALPVITIPNANVTPAHGTTSIAASSLFSASDPDGDTIQKYEFWDDGLDANSGRFMLSGVAQNANAAIQVTAANLANLSFQLGSVSDKLWVRAFDGTGWTIWKGVDVAPAANALPVITIPIANVTSAHGTTSIAASSLFSASDPDGDTIQKYEFWDDGLDANSGHFVLGGVAQNANAAIQVTAANLANLSFQLGSVADKLWVRAFDGTGWTIWKGVDVAPAANALPVITIPNATVTPGHGTTSLAASSLFSASDPDGDVIQTYEFWDEGTDPNSGHFVLSGATQGTNVPIQVAAANLANLSFQLGTASDKLWVRAYDGTAWTIWKGVNVAPAANALPIITIPNANVTPTHGTTNIAASSLFSAIDPDGDTIQQYEFWDEGLDPSSGHFVLSGATQATNAAIPVTAANLANMSFQLGTVSDKLWVRAYDGTAWTIWNRITVAAPPNALPVITIPNANVTPSAGTTSITASSLFSAADPDGDTIQQYEFWDEGVDPSSGHFVLNGAARGTDVAIPVAAANLANLSFQLGTASDKLWVRAYDGTAWTIWKGVDVAAPPAAASGGGSNLIFDSGFEESGFYMTSGLDMTMRLPDLDSPESGFQIIAVDAPVLSAADTTVAARTATSVSALLSASDPDGDAVVSWQLWDATTGGGALRVNGVAQPEHQAIELMAHQLASVDFLGGNAGGDDHLWARASDATGWGPWKPFTITTLMPV